LKKGDQISDMCHNVRFTHSSVCTIRYNADRTTESAKSVTEVFVYQECHSPIRM